MAGSSFDLESFARELNARARNHAIGALQSLRARMKRLSRQPGTEIFSRQTIHPLWAFHHGGRRELQFNVGIESLPGGDELRHGVAFSFERSQTLPDIAVLIPKVRLFNDYMQLYPDRYADMRMWDYRGKRRSSDYPPDSVMPELVTAGTFVFMGARQRLENIDVESACEVVLNDFDRLLPLYLYVESGGHEQAADGTRRKAFRFRAGFNDRAPSATASRAERELNITLRHNLLQGALCRRLIAEHGRENVADELPSGLGTKIDVVVRRRADEYWYYEIKTAMSPRACLREALGQILEYAYWPGAREAARLIICGERPLDAEGKAYLGKLQKRFGLPIGYEQIVLSAERVTALPVGRKASAGKTGRKRSAAIPDADQF